MPTKDVEALRQMYPTQIRAYFLGYVSITPTRKLHEIRAHAGQTNDWSQHYTDVDLLAIIHREIRFSKYLRAECAKYHLQYCDMSHQFLARVNEVVEYVRERR